MITNTQNLERIQAGLPPVCPHCGGEMKRMEMPPEAGYEVEFFYVCFNDECPYFVQGWNWMQNNYRATASYRHFINPVTGGSGPLPVWSQEAMKNRIMQ